MKLNIKPFQETLNSDLCGPASLKIVLSYYGVDKSEKELADLAGWKKGVGVDDLGIKKASELLGFKMEIKDNADFNDIKSWLEKSVPVIVDWFTCGRQDLETNIADGHYSVVCGLDGEFIYLQDPEIGSIRKIKQDDFLKVWFDFRGENIKEGELIIRQLIAIYK